MKLKTLARIAASGFMAASFVYVVPAYAEEYSGDDEAMAPQQLALADNSSTASSLPADVGGGMNNTSNTSNSVNATNKVDATSANASTNTSTSNNGTQPGTPDVASGDDDY